MQKSSEKSSKDKVPESPSKNDSIFLTNKSTVFWVLLKDSKNKAPEFNTRIIQDDLYRISLSTGKEQLIKCYFELNDNYLFCFKEAGKSLVAYLDLEYARMKEITYNDPKTNDKFYGIRVIKHRNYEDFLHQDEQVVKCWFECLKRFCLMSQFGLFYENIKVLGQGNFAKVFLVKRKSDQREFAVKVFDKKAILSDELEKKCLIYEVNTLRKLDNQYVMRMQELYEGQNYIYCVIEPYYGGQLLQRILKKGNFPENDSLQIIWRILKGLGYLQGENLIHRDLKPENVILRNEEDPYDVVMVDFGFSTKVQDVKLLFTRCGTPGYVAPEVLNDQPYDCKADIFSAGVILYILLTGCAPFYGESYDDVVEKNLRAKLNFNFGEINLSFRDETMDLLKKLLLKSPKDRISATDALMHPAFTYIQGKLPETDTGDSLRQADATPVHNLKDFHEKYKFDIKQFPKTKANIPDSIHDLNTPMTAPDDKRVIKQMNIQAGLTPQLQGRSLDPNVKPVTLGGGGDGLKKIDEENPSKKNDIKKNLKGWI